MMRALRTPLWSVVVLFAISAVFAVATYLASVHYYQAGQASQARQAAAQKAAQAQQAAAFERKLCTTLDGLASRKPPGGPTVDNPSRAYLQWLHGQLSQLGPDVGCKAAP